MSEYLEGCRRLRVELHFADGSTRTLECVFIETVSHDRRLRATMAHQLQMLNWPSELSAARITLLERGELVTRQRMGLQTVTGLGEQAWQRIKAVRDNGRFSDLRDVCVRTRLSRDVIIHLTRAGACDAFGERRQLLWQLGEVDYRPDELPLEAPLLAVELSELDALERTEWEYELLGLSPSGQVMRHYRAALNRAGVLSSVEAKRQPKGRVVRVGGMVVVKQRPQTAKGIVFISFGDELGMIDLIVKPNVYERYRAQLRGQTFILVEGVVQQGSGAVSVLVTRALEFRNVNVVESDK